MFVIYSVPTFPYQLSMQSHEQSRLRQNLVAIFSLIAAVAIILLLTFCLMTLEDAVKTSGNEGKIEIVDLAELAAMAL